jgi:hypothetical protein
MLNLPTRLFFYRATIFQISPPIASSNLRQPPRIRRKSNQSRTKHLTPPCPSTQTNPNQPRLAIYTKQTSRYTASRPSATTATSVAVGKVRGWLKNFTWNTGPVFPAQDCDPKRTVEAIKTEEKAKQQKIDTEIKKFVKLHSDKNSQFLMKPVRAIQGLRGELFADVVTRGVEVERLNSVVSDLTPFIDEYRMANWRFIVLRTR